jgi:hypothetical protein
MLKRRALMESIQGLSYLTLNFSLEASVHYMDLDLLTIIRDCGKMLRKEALR